METISELTSRFANPGTVTWIGVRPARRSQMLSLAHVNVTEDGLEGDHYQKSNSASAGKRSVTLLQAEHLPVISSLAGGIDVTPSMVRRNIVVSGINLLGLRNRQFQVGTALLEGAGLCAPCSRMEAELGKGGYSAVRGHGGICARVISTGVIALDDEVRPLD